MEACDPPHCGPELDFISGCRRIRNGLSRVHLVFLEVSTDSHGHDGCVAMLLAEAECRTLMSTTNAGCSKRGKTRL